LTASGINRTIGERNAGGRVSSTAKNAAQPGRPTVGIDPSFPVYPTLVHALRAAAEQAPNRTALICGDRAITYAQYLRATAGLARELSTLGAAGSRVVILMGNGIECAVAQFGAMAARAQMAPLNPAFTPRELVPLVKDADPVAIVCDAHWAEKARAVAAEAGVAHVLAFEPGGLDLEAWIDRSDLALPEPLPAADDWATLPYTGGTTGQPKGASHRHSNICWFFRQILTLWPVGFDVHTFLNVAPMFHIWGFQFATWMPVYTRSTLVIVPLYKPDDVLAALAKHRVTVFAGGPPTVYNGLMASPRFAATDLSALRYCFSGGAACPEELLKAWERATGCALLEGHGMSEGAPTTCNPIHGPHKLLSTGVTAPDTEIDIVDIETGTRVLPTGERGEIRVRGPQFTQGYRNRPDETAAQIRDGWLHTGDIGYFDADGYLFVVDRKKELINVGGYKVYPREVDEVLHAHPAVQEAATVGVADAFRGEAVKAVVALKAGATLTADDLLAFCRENLVKYKVPTQVEFIDALPKTGPGKIDKLKLRGLR
jgi:long-chain acyl-CoA synthetase